MVTRNIKSALTNQIFKQEMLHTYEQKSQSRDELVRGARRMIRQLTQEMAQSLCAAPEIEQKMVMTSGASSKNEVENYCHDKPRERKKLAQEKKFRQIKNAIIQEAENIRLGVMTFEDEKVEDRDEWVENWEVSYECLRLRAKIEDRKLPLDQRDEAVGDLE